MKSLHSFANRFAELKEDILWEIEFFFSYYYKELRYYLIRKPKYFIQRGIRGYSDEDLWNLGDYYQELIVKSLNDFSKLKSSYPLDYRNVDDWTNEIKENADKIEYFKTCHSLELTPSADMKVIERDTFDYASVRKIRDEGLQWVVSHIDNLWD
jgi:hypothetical protein